MSAAAPPARAAEHRREQLATWALVAAGSALRFWRLGQQSFWHDEVHSVIMARGNDSGALSETVFNTHGPLYLTALRCWLQLFGSSETAIRALSALIGVAGLVLFARVARRFLSPAGAFVALTLLAASPFHLGYSQEARGYGLLFALGLVAVETFLAELEQRTWRSFALALLAMLATCLSNLSGFFLLVVAGAFAWAIGQPEGYRMRRYALLVVLVAVLLEPWIVAGAESTGKFNLGDTPQHADVILAKGESPPGLASIPYSFYDFTFGRSLGPNVDDLKLYRTAALVPHLWYLVPALLLVGWLLVRGWRAADPQARRILGAWLVLPIVAMAVLSTINLKAANSRYAFLGFAPYVLLLAGGITSLASSTARALAPAALLGLFAWSDQQYFTNPYYWKPDARAAGALLTREARASDVVAVYALDFPLRYYVPDSIHFVMPTGEAFASDSGAAGWLASHAPRERRLWIVECNAWWMDRPDRFRRVTTSRRTREAAWSFEKLPVDRFRAEAP
jgi:uncharacterized membrane protein